MTVKTYSKKATGNMQLSDHFKVREFASKDGSDTVLVDDKLVQLLEHIREYFGAPIQINSAYRSPAHNAKVGGTSNSQHVKGTAADIAIKGVDPLKVAEVAEYYLGNSGGIGYYALSGFTHIDTRPQRSRWYEYKRGQITSRNSFSVVGVVQELNKRKEEAEEMVEDSKIIVNGKPVPVKRILKDGTNYVAVRQVAEALGCKVSAQGNTPVISSK